MKPKLPRVPIPTKKSGPHKVKKDVLPRNEKHKKVVPVPEDDREEDCIDPDGYLDENGDEENPYAVEAHYWPEMRDDLLDEFEGD